QLFVSAFCRIYYIFHYFFLLFFFFFFQAEDGIRDSSVTGVQTCALPIYGAARPRRLLRDVDRGARCRSDLRTRRAPRDCRQPRRSEERRVGKEGRSRGGPDQ